MRDHAIDSKVTALLLSLLRHTQSDVEAIQNYHGISVSWDELVATAARLRVAPILYDKLKFYADIPSAIMEHLKGYYLATVVSNMNLYHDLGRVLRALRAQKIDVIVLKGAFLAQAAYRNIALRPMSDIDLMVRKADLERVELLLLDLGFGPLPRRNLTEQCIGHSLDPLILGRTCIEMHWVIEDEFAPFAIDTEELWLRARQFVLKEESVAALGLEDLLLHLCLHASYQHCRFHFGAGLQPYCDIATVVRHFSAEIDWVAMLERARQWRVSNCVYLTLRLANYFVSAGVPDMVLNALAPPSYNPSIEPCAINLSLKNISFTYHYDDFEFHFPSIAQIVFDPHYCPWSLRKILSEAFFPSAKLLAILYPRLYRPGLRYIALIARWKDMFTECVRYYVFPNTQMKALRATEKERLSLVKWLLAVSHQMEKSK